MNRAPILGLSIRIAVSLAVIFGLFILVTQVSVAELTRVAVLKHVVTNGALSQTSELPAEIEEDFSKLRRLILFYLIAGAALALVLSALVIRRQVAKPIGRVNTALERVADGHLETTVPIEGARELAHLGIAFNRMTATIKEQQEALQERLRRIEASSRELEETQAKLIRAAKLASVGTLAAGIAHEIGNPLAGVLGLLETLETEVDAAPATKKRYTGLMRSEIERIDRIVRDLLAFARTPEPTNAKRVSSNLEEAVLHVKALLKAQSLFDRVEVIERIPADLGPAAISPDDLTQLLLNLMLNAAQAMNGKGRIFIDADRLEDWHPPLSGPPVEAIRVHVTDTGPGVDAADREKIFDPFYSMQPTGTGIGLGLAICQSICERAGGDIDLDTSRSKGTCFTITLRRATPDRTVEAGE